MIKKYILSLREEIVWLETYFMWNLSTCGSFRVEFLKIAIILLKIKYYLYNVWIKMKILRAF